MRMSERCTLVFKSEKHYDAELGRMIGSEVTKIVPCNIGRISNQMLTLLGDKANETSRVIRTRRINQKIDYVLIDGKKYQIDSQPVHSNALTALYVSEVRR